MKFQFKLAFFIKLIGYGLLFYFIYLLGLITWQYVPIDFDVAFLRIKQDEIQLPHYQVAFFIHVYTSIFVILAGATQFSTQLRLKYARFHKTAGKIYIALLLFFAAPSGLVMGYYANGGIIGQVSFIALSLLWFYFTLKAFLSIKKGSIKNHQFFMIRSYALTLSAVSLRLFKLALVTWFELPPMDTYKIVAVAGWTVNLGIAELIIWRLKR